MVEKTSGQHRATYSRDKLNGGYIIRVIGPYANMFAGRTVPVYRQGEADPSNEKLDRLVWSGVDDGTYNRDDAGKPVALYTFEAHERMDRDEIPF
jgi:hypothetical protein